ncbi:hypothetical protein DPMN_025198 [Dreissena polymorpha]|uniref:Sushi domain-containing protein n=1 Tax=Dreissena polymorpha TaxID=45954 RepID=A0A9D4RD42_DREPO|nr:hypothetical protein DPMN_025198 [Dreissena polymorpha]
MFRLTAVQCAAESVLHAVLSPSLASFDYDSKVNYICVTGYELKDGDLERTCQADKTWSGLTPNCSIKSCDKVDVAHASVIPDQPRYDYNKTITYTCDRASNHISGDLVRMCDDTPQWTGMKPTCTLFACLPPNNVSFGTFSPVEIVHLFDTNVTYTCTAGYYISAGDHAITCQTDGSWSGTIPTCTLVQCPTEVVVNATFTPNQAKLDYNNVVTYTCDLAYNHTDGDLQRTCQENFTWTGNTPVCTRMFMVICAKDIIRI